LKENLKCPRRFYRYFAEMGLDLTLADKSGLVKHLSETDHTNWSDLWEDDGRYFVARGFKSKTFDRLMKYREDVVC